jgi:BolA family transcriptional regulator, general stress-responsive regulator
MSMKERISARLIAEFEPTHLDIRDESELHRGHGGWREGGETHFRIIIRAATFETMSRIARHRAINAVMHEAFEAGLHALALDVAGPNEVVGA